MHTPSHTNVCKFSQFSTHIFSADITPKMLKVCRVTKVKVFFLVLVYVFNFDSFEFRPPFWRRVYTTRTKLDYHGSFMNQLHIHDKHQRGSVRELSVYFLLNSVSEKFMHSCVRC